jgi:hypothetical protein
VGAAVSGAPALQSPSAGSPAPGSPAPPSPASSGAPASASSSGGHNNVLTAVLALLRELDDSALDRVAAAAKDIRAQRVAQRR